MSFVHLHLHTHYSFLQGLWKPEAFVSYAKELGMDALAITDTNNLHGSFEFYLLCKKKGIKPIIWVELFICEQGKTYQAKDAKVYSIILLAKNHNWFKNLIQLVTRAYLEGNYWNKPQIDFPLLEKYSDDTIALSGDLMWELAQHVVSGRKDEFLLERIAYYQSIFWENHFYLEMSEHPDRGSQGAYNQKLLELSRISWTPIVATNDTHYSQLDLAEAQDFLSCIGSGRRIDDPDRRTMIDGNYSLRSTEEMNELFAYAPEACENTRKIADMIDIDIPYWTPLLPTYALNEDEKIIREKYLNYYPEDIHSLSEQEWLLRLNCYRWLILRYDFILSEWETFACVHKHIKKPLPSLKDLSPQELNELPKQWRDERKEILYSSFTDEKKIIFDRLEYELTVVHLMGFDGYFVIVADFIAWARNNTIPVWPWRWSAAGAIIAYLSGITNIDPLRYQLLFERFLNPARVSMPDIDIDFSDEGRGRVIEYVREKYWHDQVGQICTFGTLAARAAVKDVGKALGLPFSEMNAFSKMIPARPGITIADAIKENNDLQKIIRDSPLHGKLITNAQKLEWTVRQLWVHACAVIIAPSPITDFCPLQHPPKDTQGIVTQFSAYPLDNMWLLKMDFLWLRNLTIIDRALRIIENNHGIRIDIDKLNMEDQKVFDIFTKWDTTGVFQFESAGMRRYLQELEPNTFEDIIVMVSLYRPGPLQYIPTYIRRKHGKEKVRFPHSSLEQILKLTQGIAVYQEQIMQIVQAFAWFSLGEADILRRAMGKKIRELMEEQKGKFIEAAIKQWHTEKLATYIFTEIIEPFAGYGFNKSHAACYSMIAYQTAYLKAYYPTEFLTALMVSDEDDTERIVLEINEARSKNIQVLVPDVNESRKHFTYINENSIRFGLKAVKWIWHGPVESILRWREDGKYISLEDFIKRTWGDVINKKTLDALVKSGALDSFWERWQMLANVEKMSLYLKEIEHKTATQQMDMFSLNASTSEHSWLILDSCPPMSFETRIREERSVVWMSISGNPLDGLWEYIQKKSIWLQYVDEMLEEMNSISNEDPAAAEEIWELTIDIVREDWDDLVTEIMPISIKNDYKQKPIAQLIWYVDSIKKIQTRKGDNMLIVSCSGINWKFTTLVFPKFYASVAHHIVEWEIICVKWKLSFKPEMREISLEAEHIKRATISQLREAARAEWLLTISDDSVFVIESSDETGIETQYNNPLDESQLFPALCAQHICNVDKKNLIIMLDKNTSQEIFVSIKDILEAASPWDFHVWIDIDWQRIDTKKHISSYSS